MDKSFLNSLVLPHDIHPPSTDAGESKKDGYLYMGKNGKLVLELPENETRKQKIISYFDLDEEERFTNTIRLFNLTHLDARTKMEGYSWLPEWETFIYKNMILAYPLH